VEHIYPVMFHSF